ncbi:MAG: transcription factor Hsf1-related protein [Amphiamblys sp. WSBS2006]|nr:MAG: transcription factor Hsf1-related protein [Amphiamblys sp. WSBS2006]
MKHGNKKQLVLRQSLFQELLADIDLSDMHPPEENKTKELVLFEEPAKPKKNVLPFIKTLHEQLAGCAEHPKGVRWDASGTSIEIYDMTLFNREFLGRYYKHTNIPSFVRQLNIYHFEKVRPPQRTEHLLFRNPHFRRDETGEQHLIERKRQRTNNLIPHQEPEQLNQQMFLIQQKQNAIYRDLKAVLETQQELHAELRTVREQQKRQSDILEGLLRFVPQRKKKL